MDTTINISPLSTAIPHPNITPLTAQEVFDAGLFGIRRQNYAKSFNTDLGVCVYRGPDRIKCVIGHSMPDEIYRPEFDTCDTPSISSLLCIRTAETAALRMLYAAVPTELMARMQDVHDSLLSMSYPTEDSRCYAADQFEGRMQKLADEYNLVYTPV